jgi:putative photosynthetic complex assembly protein
MSDLHHEQKVPRALLLGAALLIAFTFALAAASRPRLLRERAQPLPPPLESIELGFEDREGGTLAVVEIATRRDVALLAPTNSGFVRGVLRGMFRERKLEALGHDAVFTLARQADHRLTLEDHQTHRRIELDSFGPDNSAAFAALLDAGKRAQR